MKHLTVRTKIFLGFILIGLISAMASTIGNLSLSAINNEYREFLSHQNTIDYTYTIQQLDKSLHQASLTRIAAVLATTATSIIVGIYISNAISTPIKTMSDFFTRFGKSGDLSMSENDKNIIQHNSKSTDEIGSCISSVSMMMERITEISEKLTRVSDNDLTVELEVLSEKDSIGLAMKKMLDKLNDMFSELRMASSQVAQAATQISQGAQELSSGSNRQVSSIEEFSTSLAQLQERIRHNAENAVNAQTLSGEAGTLIGESISSMKEMLEAMKEIDDSAKNITKVINVIDEIAFQTNILALNATVEAARAGQHGKGFAVVADEVRNLANKSADAARETAALIEGSSEKVKEGNEIVLKTNSSLESVVVSAKHASDLLEEVAVASTQQAVTIKEINYNIEQISNVVQKNSSSAQDSAAASEEMSSQAHVLNDIIGRFKLRPAAISSQSLHKIQMYTEEEQPLTSFSQIMNDMEQVAPLVSNMEKY